MTVRRPGPETVVVEDVVVAVNTVAPAFTQVIVVPACAQVVACARASLGRKRIAAAVEAELNSNDRVIEFFINALLSSQMPREFATTKTAAIQPWFHNLLEIFSAK